MSATEVDPPEGVKRWNVEWDLRETTTSTVLMRRQYLWKEPPGPWKDVATFIDRFWAESVVKALQSHESPAPIPVPEEQAP